MHVPIRVVLLGFCRVGILIESMQNVNFSIPKPNDSLLNPTTTCERVGISNLIFFKVDGTFVWMFVRAVCHHYSNI